MPDPISMRKVLDELSSSGGGSLVKKVTKAEITSSGKVLVIGLGGMGCKTVNTTKGVYLRDFYDTGRIQFLAVDTAQGDMDELNVQAGGNLTLNDTFPVYDSSADGLLIKRPPVVESWLSVDVPAEPIKGDGAKQRRAVGRVMLCATPKYEALRARISSKINSLTVGANEILQVVIVAGVSGGTGSGTFIDISYMVRMLLDDLHEDRSIKSEMYGVFYTPDVQKSIPAIGGNPDRWSNLQRNGYAAFKELDYFMSVGNEQITDTVYSVKTLDKTYTSHKRLFERGNVYIVSPTATCYRCEDIIETTAQSLMDLFRNGATDGANMTQSLISELSNATSLGNTWDLDIGKVADDATPADNSGIKNTLLPAFMNYNFSALGVRSIYFPRNEMVAYCSNEAFLEVYKEWSKAFEFTQQSVCQAASSCKIGSIDEIYAFVAAQLNISGDKLRVYPDETAYPVKKMFKVDGTDDTVTEATEKVNRNINSISQTVCNNIIDSLASSIISKFEDQNFLYNSGPFAAIVLLSGHDGRLKGFIQLLADYSNNIALAVNEKQQELDRATEALRKGKQTLDSDRNPHSDEIEVFISLCQKYSEAYFEYSFYSRFMRYIIDGVRSKLNAFNSETFEIYVPIIKCVMDMLSNDATAFAQSTLRVEGNSSIYSLNAFALNDARNQNDLFRTIFDGYIDKEKVDAVKQQFVASMFAPDRKAKWKNISENPSALADEIRSLFNSVTGDLVSQMLEKLMVIVYGDANSIIARNNNNQQVTIADINNIWNDTNLRNNALSSAASNIVDSLIDSLMLKFEVDHNTANEFSKKATVILLNETRNLNTAIVSELHSRFGDNFVDVAYMGDGSVCEHKTCITMAMSKTFVPLAMVSGMRNYAQEYFRSEKSPEAQAGRHLDEVTEKWQNNLPEIFGMDAEAYYAERGRTDLVISDADRATDENGVRNQDRRAYDIIRDAVDYGIKYKYIWPENGKYKFLELTDKSPEFMAQIEARLLQIKANNPAATWIDALHSIEADLHINKTKVIFLDTNIANAGLKAKQTERPDNDFDLKNIYRLVRADMRMAKLVVEAKAFYEGANFFYTMDNLAALRNNVALFVKAIKVDALSYDPQSGWFCKYSDSQYEPPIKFFDDYMRKNDKLDIPFKWYLVFSAFVKNVVCNDVAVQGIVDKFNEMEQTRTAYASWDYVMDEMQVAMAGELMRIRDPQARAQAIEPYYLNSNYKELYCYPKKYTTAQDLIDNFNKFIDELNYCRTYMLL